jgi:phenylalanyl-tRNA synthetase beta chain
MIITRSWLSNFIDLSDISTDKICEKLNSIGLEVDSVKSFKVPEKVLVGKIISCEPHPNADKLQICKIDLGTAERVIVCGAKNARAGIYVAVAVLGAKLPSGLEIKPVKLRDVESDGMLCSSEELGLPKLNDGIIELDSSIGKLVKGKELSSYPVFNDDVIDIELTANRGDCLSIYGVARELSTIFDKSLEKISPIEEDSKRGIGIARILNVDFEQNLDSSLMYKVIDFNEDRCVPLLIELLLKYIEKEEENFFDKIVSYILHTIGVIVKIYDLEKIKKYKDVFSLKIKKDEMGLDSVYNGKEKISTIGINKLEESIDSSKVIVEFSYIKPDLLSVAVTENNLDTDELYYNTSRGSEPNLSFGVDYLNDLFSKYFQDVSVYTGEYENIHELKSITIPTDIEKISKIIGQNIDSNVVLRILKSLGFKTNIRNGSNSLVTTVPSFRHDIKNIQDITEEIVRIIGIDNIVSTPMNFIEKPKLNKEYLEYKNINSLRQKSVASGFYENISFVFCSKDQLRKYGFDLVDEKLEITNPISSELNTLRSTILVNLINIASMNVKNGYKKVALFEIGSVFSEYRVESKKISFIYGGYCKDPSLHNNGKAVNIDFFEFANKISSVIGDFELKPIEDIANKLIHPNASANIIKNNKIIGIISKLHISVQKEFDLPDTFIAEIDFDKIDFNQDSVKEISKFPMVVKDLSFVVPKSLSYVEIKNSLLNIDEKINKFFPLDIYEDESLEDSISLTIRFNIQSTQKTLKDKDINEIMNKVIDNLKSNFNISLR